MECVEIAAFTCLLLLVATTFIHYEVLRLLTSTLPVLRIRPRLQLIIVILGAFCAHFLEILLYGVAYWVLASWFDIGGMGPPGPLPFSRCLYFSAETYTTLGYGDVLPHGDLRLLAGLEALNGMLLIGWTASFTFLSMERFWGDGQR
nr:potassium channel family protein [Massilia norwichensis]